MSDNDIALPPSILDTDLYKLTMQQAILTEFPDIPATYRFNNRDKTVLFSRHCVEQFMAAISQFSNLSLTNDEQQWLSKTCPFLAPSYLAYLAEYRYKPQQVQATFEPTSEDGMLGELSIIISGPWVETILWEVPVMACLSEIYFKTVKTDWNYDNQEELAFLKARTLLETGCVFSDFGTRRRRSFHAHELVLQGLIRASDQFTGKGSLTGTSNVHLAHKYGLSVIGTIAHEWFMGIAALKGYERANSVALDLWEKIYSGSTLIALTDTFTSEVFFRDFVSDPRRAQRWVGLRQDSGSPFSFAVRAKGIYDQLGINPAEKLIVYSDSLDVHKALELKKHSDSLGLTKVSFGIGTFLTNDFKTVSSGGGEKSKALNMVIKLASVNDIPCVKLSDDPTKVRPFPAHRTST
ncbi:nicotinate phosphoribosyltransferase [Infundibulicybe gibba]|nr:nicotinate phosphoribosyltransferase [Infundibulicybe gibba]